MHLAQSVRCSPSPDRSLVELLLIDTLILAAFAGGLIGASLMIMAHGAAIAIFAAGSRARFKSDATLFVLATITCGSTGPLGAVAILVLSKMSRSLRIPPADLQLWHDRLSGVTEAKPGVELAEKLKAGRFLRREQRVVTNFHLALVGPLATQQRVLGAVGLSYHPAYLGILSAALASSEPSIRVHAAAVTVKLRTKTKFAIRAALQAQYLQPDNDANLSIASVLAKAARSGFLETSDRVLEARTEALRRCEQVLVEQPLNRLALTLKCELLFETGSDAEALSLAEAHRLDRHSPLRDKVAEAFIRSRRIYDVNRVLGRSSERCPILGSDQRCT